MGNIKNHPIFSEYERLDFLLKISKTSPDLSEKSFEYLFVQHPIVVIPTTKGDYYCIGGVRTLSLARSCFREDHIIKVNYVTGLSKAQIIEHCHFDLVLPALCFSTASHRNLSDLLDKLPPDFTAKILNRQIGPSSSAKLLNISRETKRRWMKEHRKNS